MATPEQKRPDVPFYLSNTDEVSAFTLLQRDMTVRVLADYLLNRLTLPNPSITVPDGFTSESLAEALGSMRNYRLVLKLADPAMIAADDLPRGILLGSVPITSGSYTLPKQTMTVQEAGIQRLAVPRYIVNIANRRGAPIVAAASRSYTFRINSLAPVQRLRLSQKVYPLDRRIVQPLVLVARIDRYGRPEIVPYSTVHFSWTSETAAALGYRPKARDAVVDELLDLQIKYL